MPARKPGSMQRRHSTKAEKAARLESEESLTSDRKIPERTIPVAIKDDKVAAAVWRKMVRAFNRLESKVIDSLDRDLLIDYCMVMSQIAVLDGMREDVKLLSSTYKAILAKAADEPGNVVFMRETADKLLESNDRILKLDARVDQKRKLAFAYRQSMFMTPRSRTGVTPTRKEDAPTDPMADLLGNKPVSQFNQMVGAKLQQPGGPSDGGA